MDELTIDWHNRIEEKSLELKALIAAFDSRSFLIQVGYLSNRHVRHRTGYVKLRSPVRQLVYLISLFQSTVEKPGRVFDPTGPDMGRIIELLNEIDAAYRENGTGVDPKKEFIVASTFFNFYSNAPLTYLEQDIERITRTFQPNETAIVAATGLAIQDYIDFFKLITILEKQHYQRHVDYHLSSEDLNIITKSVANPQALSPYEQLRIRFFEKRIEEVLITKAELYEAMPAVKVDKLLDLFTLRRKANPAFNYYNDVCPYMYRPILQPDDQHINFVFSKQLINAVYEHLFGLCSPDERSARRIFERRDKYLEQKSLEVLTDFFESHATVYTNYTIGDNEKDILVIQDKTAYIIECKANRQRPPLRDAVKAYDRIKDDFDKCIGKGFSQAKEVYQLLEKRVPFTIRNHKGQTVVIDAAAIEEAYMIIVTGERFGQLQCDLDYLLELGVDDVYPWSVYLDDLETFLITLKRRKEHLKEFREYLFHREDLHGRLFCYDEMEMFSYFLFDRSEFYKYCASDLDIYSSPDINLIFDELYNLGLGLKDEINLAEKLKLKSVVAEAFIKKNKLGLPARIAAFKRQGSMV